MERLRGMSYSVEDFEETVADMLIAGVKMDKRTHTMMMLFYMLQQEKEVQPVFMAPTEAEAES